MKTLKVVRGEGKVEACEERRVILIQRCDMQAIWYSWKDPLRKKRFIFIYLGFLGLAYFAW